MPKRKASSPLPFGDFDEDFEDETCSDDSKTNQPVQRNAANARERARMRVLSGAFCRLKTKLPWVPADTKLSKLDTLRLATIYIQQLRASVSTGTALNVQATTSATTTSAFGGCGGGGAESSTASACPSDRSAAAAAPNVQSMVWPFSFAQSINENRYAGASSGTTTTAPSTGLTHWLSATTRLGAVTANCSANDHH